MLNYFLFLVLLISFTRGYPEQGKWNFTLTQNALPVLLPKSLFKGSQIFMEVTCKPNIDDAKIVISWCLIELQCWDEYLQLIENPPSPLDCTSERKKDNRTIVAFKSDADGIPCLGHIKLPKLGGSDEGGGTKNVKPKNHPKEGDILPVITVPKDAFYLFLFHIEQKGGVSTIDVLIEMLGEHGYLSAADWPLLPFYGLMCIVYVTLGAFWLIVLLWQWRDLLRIQFWIGGVILLGMLEKATFYAEYRSINSTGVRADAVVLTAEIVSCAKRTLARILVVIVSHGFGIVKPRLGALLQRVLMVGVVYMCVATGESYMRVWPRGEGNEGGSSTSSRDLLLLAVPLAVLDSIICWWVFTALVHTTRTLRLRRNTVKLTLYRHFTNTLIFAVLSSLIFMVYNIKTRRIDQCLADWKEFWVDEAFWHVLFSLILVVIMFLWRPTANNQRYAFTPLLDNADDDEDEHFVSDAYEGMKMRNQSRGNSPKPSNHQSDDENDDLKWINDNIPSAAGRPVDSAVLPILDSDEEVLTTKFEVSKML